jgi:hypothetical protein
MSRRISSNNNSSSSTGAIAVGAGAGLISGAGGTTLTTCSPTDTSFYCQFMRFIGIIKGFIFLLTILVVIYFLWQWYKGSK